jgi:hypothetical protein
MSDDLTPHTKTIDLKRGLRAWADKYGITPTKFCDDTGYRYAHAQGLMNGDRPVTFEMLGRFIKAYGPLAGGELLTLSGMPVKLADSLPRPDDEAQVVPVVYLDTERDPATQTA